MSGVNYRGRARLRDQQATERLSALLEGVAQRTHDQPDATAPTGEPDTSPAGHREPVIVRRFFTRPAFIVLVLVLLGVCGVSAMSLLPGNTATDPVAVASTKPSGSTQHPATTPTPTTPHTTLTVHVVGEVRKPSVVQVPPGARVIDAVKAAGGLTDAAVTDHVNLAQQLTDGQQVAIPNQDTPATTPMKTTPGGAPPSVPNAPPAEGTPNGPVNLNTATPAELENLPRVGPVLAQRIVDFRTENGPFTAVEQLDDISGVGTAMLQALSPLVTV